jgi:membrane-associated protease RseP (regulator of RpoE activity)
MSKKTNTLLFILAGTVFNVLITIISFVLLFVLFIRFLAPMLPENVAAFGFIVVFVAAIALAFFTYRAVMKQITKRVDIDKYFDPLFGPRRRYSRRD